MEDDVKKFIEKYNESEVADGGSGIIDGSSGTIIASEDINKWEMESEPLLDKIYNKLVGNSEMSDGTWDRDDDISRLMNELGASEFIQELRIRFNINMQMSELRLDDIKRMCSDAASNFADKLEDNWALWEIDPSPSNLRSISMQLFDCLFIVLSISLNGGMKRHREKRGIKNFFNPMSGVEAI